MSGHGPRMLLAFALGALSSCAPPPAPPPHPTPPPAPRALSVSPLESPAPLGSAQPDLAVDGAGRALLSWIESSPDGSRALGISRLDGTSWSPLAMPHRGQDILANWADTPRLGIGTGVHVNEGRLALSWPRLQGAGSEGYDVVVQLSNDDGRTWSAPITPHRDGTATEHDFPSLHADPAGGLGVVWLDGRAHEGSTGHGGHGDPAAAQALMTATIAPDGTLGPERVLDARVCDCCATASILAGESVVVAYRDRSGDEVRDISVVRLVPGEAGPTWTEPAPIAADGWKLAGCPVNGPALAARGSRVALAWFTSPDSGPRVKLAFSDDGGATFGAPVSIDDGEPLGRVDVALLPDGAALVAWAERGAPPLASLRVRVVDHAGKILAGASVADIEAGRSAGFARLAAVDDAVLVAWTATEGASTRVRVASVRWD